MNISNHFNLKFPNVENKIIAKIPTLLSRTSITARQCASVSAIPDDQTS